MSLKVLVVGGGGREHALVKALKKSPLLESLECAPGNGGIARDCPCVPILASDVDSLAGYAVSRAFDLVVIGPEIPLSMGLADRLRSKGVAVYGPNRDGAMLEASKAFSKDFMKRNNVPTAEGEKFSDFSEAEKYIRSVPFDTVVKASGLAAGKGVVVPSDRDGAVFAAKKMLDDGAFGDSGREIVVEEKMEGEEASIMLVVCGKNYVMLPASQDHKRVGDGDTGLNTGGMGAYAPAAVATPEILRMVRERIVEPVLAGLAREGIDYRGTLYVGIMVTKSGPKVVEFNVRFGDPECQVLMPLIESDALKLMYDVALGKLDADSVKISEGYSAVVVVCAKGYPGPYKKGDVVTLPADGDIPESSWIVHAGTKAEGGKILTAGGRVLGLVGCAPTLEGALGRAYKLADMVGFDGAFYRRDIGGRQLRRQR